MGFLATWGVRAADLVLFVFSVISVAIMLERIYLLRRWKAAEDSDYRSLKDALQNGELDNVRACAAAGMAPCAATLQAGLAQGNASPERVRTAIEQELEEQNEVLHHKLPILATVASTAPYVGLFGTVLGILGAFQQIQATGQTGASVVAGGISSALTSTAFGLGVAIPAVMAYNYLTGVVNRFSLRVETHTLDLAGRLEELNATVREGEPREGR